MAWPPPFTSHMSNAGVEGGLLRPPGHAAPTAIPEISPCPFADTPQDSLYHLLLRRGAINEHGILTVVPEHLPLPPLPLPQLEAIKSFLAAPRIIKANDNSFQITISLQELIGSLQSSHPLPKAAGVEIVGGAVYWFLGPVYIQHILEQLGFKICEEAFYDSLWIELQKMPIDFDIRYNLPGAGVEQLKSTAQAVVAILSKKIQAEGGSTGRQSLIFQKGFTKYKSVNDGGNCLFSLGFGDRRQNHVDLLLVDKLLRDHLFMHDALRIEIRDLLSLPPSKLASLRIVPQGNYQQGWASIILKMCKLVNARNVISIDIPGSVMLPAYYTKGWRCPSQDLEKTLLENVETLINSASPTDREYYEIKKCLLNHFKGNPLASIALAFNACALLSKYGRAGLVPKLLERMQNTFDPPPRKSRSQRRNAITLQQHVFAQLAFLLKEGKTPFDLVLAFLQMQGLVYINSSPSGEKSRYQINLTVNARSPAIQFKVNDDESAFTLLFPYEPVKGATTLLEYFKEPLTSDQCDMLKMFEDLSEAINDDDLFDESIKTTMQKYPGTLKHEIQALESIAHRFLEKPFPLFLKIGLSLLASTGISDPTAKCLPTIFKNLPNALHGIKNPHTRMRLLRQSLLLLQNSLASLGQQGSLPHEPLCTAILKPNPGKREIQTAFCHTLASISHPEIIPIVYNQWAELAASGQNDETVSCGFTILKHYLAHSPAWSLRILAALQNMACARPEDCRQAYISICSACKQNNSSCSLNASLPLLGQALKQLILTASKSQPAYKGPIHESFPWTIRQLIDTHPDLAMAILVLSQENGFPLGSKAELSKAWLDCAKMIRSQRGLRQAISMVASGSSFDFPKERTSRQEWTAFLIEIAEELLSQDSTEANAQAGTLLRILCRPDQPAESLGLISAVVTVYFERMLPRSSPHEAKSLLEGPFGNYLPHERKIDFYKRIFNDELQGEDRITALKEPIQTLRLLTKISAVSEDKAYFQEGFKKLFNLSLSFFPETMHTQFLVKLLSTDSSWASIYEGENQSKAEFLISALEAYQNIPFTRSAAAVSECAAFLAECHPQFLGEGLFLRSAIALGKTWSSLSLGNPSGAVNWAPMIRQNCEWVLKGLRESCEKGLAQTSDIIDLSAALLEMGLGFPSNAEALTQFWRGMEEYLQKCPGNLEGPERAQQMLALLPRDPQRSITLDERRVLLKLAELFITAGHPLKAVKHLEKLLRHGSPSTDCTNRPEPSLGKLCLLCFEKLREAKDPVRALSFLTTFEGGTHVHDTQRAQVWLEMASDFETRDPGKAMEIYLQKHGLLIRFHSQEPMQRHVSSFLSTILAKVRKPALYAACLELLGKYSCRDARIWHSLMTAISFSGEVKNCEMALQLLLNRGEPQNLLCGSPAERALCWVAILKPLAQQSSKTLLGLLEHLPLLLTLFEGPGLASHNTQACYLLNIGWFKLLHSPHKYEAYENKILQACKATRAALQTPLDPSLQHELDLAYVQAFIAASQQSTFVNVCMALAVLLKSADKSHPNELLRKLSWEAAEQFKKFKENLNEVTVITIFAVKEALQKLSADALDLVPFIESFSQTSNRFLLEDAYELVLYILDTHPANFASKPERACKSIIYLCIKLINEHNNGNCTRLLHLFNHPKIHRFLSPGELASLWGQLTSMALVQAKISKRKDFSHKALEFFLDNFRMLADCPHMEGKCIELATDNMLSLFFLHKDSDLFNNTFISICKVFLENSETGADSRSSNGIDPFIQAVEFQLPSRHLQNNFKGDEIQEQYFSKYDYSDTVDFSNAGPRTLNDIFNRCPKKLLKAVRERFFHFMSDFLDKILSHASDDPMDQGFIIGNTWVHMESLMQNFGSKTNLLSTLLYSFAFRYAPPMPGLFRVNMKTLYRLFNRAQALNILDTTPEKTFELVLLLDMNICLKPCTTSRQNAKSLANVITLCTSQNNLLLMCRAMLILEKMQFRLLLKYPHILKKCYETLITAVKINPFFAIEGVTAIERLRRISLEGNKFFDEEASSEIHEAFSVIHPRIFATLLEAAYQSDKIRNEMTNYNYLVDLLSCLSRQAWVKSHPEHFLAMVEEFLPLALANIHEQPPEIILNLLLKLPEPARLNQETRRSAAQTLNKWIKLLLSIPEGKGEQLAHKVFEQALFYNFYSDRPDEFQSIWKEMFKVEKKPSQY